MMRILFSIYLLVSIFSGTQLLGQFNVKVGYGLSYTTGNQVNDLISTFNESNGFRLEKNMNEIHVVHGLELGLRYSFDDIALEGGWEGQANNVIGLGEDVDGSLFSKEMFFNFSNIYIGVEKHIGTKGFGVALGRRKASIKAEIASTDFKKTVVSDHQMNLKLYWMLNFIGGDFIGLSLRPYVQWPLNSIDFTNEVNPGTYESALHDFLEIPEPESSVTDKFPMVGISILFYNGLQSD